MLLVPLMQLVLGAATALTPLLLPMLLTPLMQLVLGLGPPMLLRMLPKVAGAADDAAAADHDESAAADGTAAAAGAAEAKITFLQMPLPLMLLKLLGPLMQQMLRLLMLQ